MTRLFSEPLAARLEWRDGELTALAVGPRRLAIVEVLRRWRVEASWWEQPVARDYLTLRTADGLVLDVFCDRRTGSWWLQRIVD